MISEYILTQKDERFISIAYNKAIHSKQLMMHGAVIVKNGKPLYSGFNYRRTHTKDKFVSTEQPSCHAEISAIRGSYYLNNKELKGSNFCFPCSSSKVKRPKVVKVL